MIHTTIHFDTTPETLYQMFVDSKLHSEFTGARAAIDPTIGGSFSVWDGYATGTTTELFPGKKIVQQWRAGDWPEGLSSTITLLFHPRGETTELEFIHEGVPPEYEQDIKQGWTDYYWNPLKQYLARHEQQT